jgi:hypothetical protein
MKSVIAHTDGSRLTVVSVLCSTAICRLASKCRRTDCSLKSDTAVYVVWEALGDNEGAAKVRI